MRRELLAGCGSARVKLMWGNDTGQSLREWQGLITLDINADHKPNVVANLDNALPFADDSFDEVHLYEVLEHLGRQGDYKSFFALFSEFYRVLRPGAILYATVPAWNDRWAWGDPSHTRIINEGTLIFLDQDEYAGVGVTPMTDFRYIWKGNFKATYSEYKNGRYYFALEKR